MVAISESIVDRVGALVKDACAARREVGTDSINWFGREIAVVSEEIHQNTIASDVPTV